MSLEETSVGSNFGRLARRASERLAVVRHVLETPGLQETDYLEWKTGYDLSRNPGAAATGKHLIGFANRAFEQAARHADGHAYLLLGVEPENLVGAHPWDAASIEDWLVRFVGRELRYDAHYVELAGRQVLFLTVDPPKQGDPIYCLQQSSGEPGGGRTLPAGTIYVRRNGQTGVADAADIARLTARACAVTSTLAMRVELDTSNIQVMDALLLSDAVRNEWVERQRASLYSKMPQPSSADPFTRNFQLAAAPERRSREEFMDEVEAYAKAATEQWTSIVAVQHVEAEEPELVAVVVNDTEHNFEDVVLELTLPVDIKSVFRTPGEAGTCLEPPERPAEWGRGLYTDLDLVPSIIPRLGPREPRPELEEISADSTLVQFPPFHVRPHTRHRMPRLLLALPPQLAGTTLKAHWRVTARNTPGQLEGDADLSVAAKAEADHPAPELPS